MGTTYPPLPWTTEQHIALREAFRNSASNDYFEARPQLDGLGYRDNFEAAFSRGFDAAMAIVTRLDAARAQRASPAAPSAPTAQDEYPHMAPASEEDMKVYKGIADNYKASLVAAPTANDEPFARPHPGAGDSQEGR